MQDRYVGDVGDFAKYALLRLLIRTSIAPLRLGVIWYLHPDESHNLDGRHTGYLSSERYRVLDPELHGVMQHLVRTRGRTVAEVRKSGVFPPSTIFYEEPVVDVSGLGASVKERLTLRTEWFIRAQAAVRDTDLVFLDPDNGIEPRSVPKGARKSGKYVYWDEIKRLWQGGHSLLIYHHLNRTANVATQTQLLAAKLAERLQHLEILEPLLFRRGSCRHFWLLGQFAHAPALKAGISQLLSSGWGDHFERAHGTYVTDFAPVN